VLNAQDLDAVFAGEPMDVFTVKHTGRTCKPMSLLVHWSCQSLASWFVRAPNEIHQVSRREATLWSATGTRIATCAANFA